MNITKQVCVLILVISVIGCKSVKDEEVILQEFQIPKIINTIEDSTKQKEIFEAHYIEEVYPQYAGKYKFSSEIDIFQDRRNSPMRNDYTFDNLRRLIEIDSLKHLDVNGFELIVDYETEIYKELRYKNKGKIYCYYPIYFVNSTSTEKVFFGKDDYIYGIQEAQDTSNSDKWKPIEARGWDMCGNGTWGLIVRPKEFIVVLMTKYKGNELTKIRTRFRIGATTYVSKPFFGSINSNQFKLSDSTQIGYNVKRNYIQTLENSFYGASLKDRYVD
jgi:hypothetical protein